MKLSRYNKIYNVEDNKKLLFNSSTCGLAEVGNNEFEIIKKIFNDIKNNGECRCEQDEIVNNLKQGNFIIEDDIDELEVLRFKSNLRTFNSNQLTITIAPTLKCNFACTYCYESNVNTNNNINNKKEFIDSIKKLITHQMKAFKIDTVFIGWYGGEPLLEYDFIIDTCKQINDFMQSKNVSVVYGIISNGYYLDEAKAIQLKELGFINVQITLDGTKNVHDKRRILKDGSGTFDKIIKNIHEIYKYLTINIRVNVDKNNIDNMEEFLNYLIEENLKDKIGIGFAQTRDDTECCSSANSKCFGFEEFSNELIKLYSLASQKGFIIDFYVHPKDIYCGATTPNSFLVEPDGTLQKCWSNIGKKESSIGNIFNLDEILFNSNSIKWTNWNNDVFKNNKCTECDILPICMGGCAYEAIERNHSIPQCTIDKYYFEEKIKFNYYHENKSK